ncbi:MAG: metallophosphoesterase [Chlamydiota bacterium]
MSIWVLSDLHLAVGNPSKDMSVFGPSWERYMDKIEKNWRSCVQEEDLVLIPGDISWASTLEQAKIDLNWIHALPGTKVIIKGNHDYWWASNAKMEAALPSSIHYIYNNAFHWKDITLAGSRLWDTEEYNFTPFIEFVENPRERKENKVSLEESQKIFEKELERLRRSLECLDPKASFRIALVHYPPIGSQLEASKASNILEEFHIDICVFGHLHNVRENSLPFGTKEGVQYVFASADYLDFMPLKIR